MDTLENGGREASMAEIVECKDFNCENYKDGKCTLDKVIMVVIENELVCENANEPTNAGITYI